MDPDLIQQLLPYLMQQLQLQQQGQAASAQRIPQYFEGKRGEAQQAHDLMQTPRIDNFTGGYYSPEAHQSAWDNAFRAPSTEGGESIGQVINRPGFGWGSWMPGQGGARWVAQSGPGTILPGSGRVTDIGHGPAPAGQVNPGTGIVTPDLPYEPGQLTSLPLEYLSNDGSGEGRTRPTTGHMGPAPTLPPSVRPLPSPMPGPTPPSGRIVMPFGAPTPAPSPTPRQVPRGPNDIPRRPAFAGI